MAWVHRIIAHTRNEEHTCPRTQKHELVSPPFSPRCRREGAVMIETRPQPRALAEHQPRLVVLVRHTRHRPLQRSRSSERTKEQSCTSTHRSGRQGNVRRMTVGRTQVCPVCGPVQPTGLACCRQAAYQRSKPLIRLQQTSPYRQRDTADAPWAGFSEVGSFALRRCLEMLSEKQLPSRKNESA